MSSTTTIVLGLGATGYSCIRHLAGRDRVLAFDTRRHPPFLDAVRHDHPEVAILSGRDWRRALSSAHRLVVSPGIALDHCLVSSARAAGVALASDIELFLEAVRTEGSPAPVIGVTGTNGKSTVAALVGELLAASGADIGVGGNLGTPALDLLAEGRDGYVLELSSFQLERLQRPGLAVASVLNVSPDHLDRYPSLDSYAASKRRIYAGAEWTVYDGRDPRTAPAADMAAIALHEHPRWRLDGEDLVIDGHRLPAAILSLKGRHNHCNALAAAAIAHQAGTDAVAQADTLTAFRGLPHRSATVAEIDGAAYVDDSKATNVGACLAALEGFGNGMANIVLIAGGDAKGASFGALADAVGRHVSRLVLLGRDADRLAQALGHVAEVVPASDMRAAVRLAQERARPGDIVLLSPACASFDMYANFQARGDDFAAAVRALAGSTEVAR